MVQIPCSTERISSYMYAFVYSLLTEVESRQQGNMKVNACKALGRNLTEACRCSTTGGEVACTCVDSKVNCTYKANELYCKYQGKTCQGPVNCPAKEGSASICRVDSAGSTLLQMIWTDGTSCDAIDCNDNGMYTLCLKKFPPLYSL